MVSGYWALGLEGWRGGGGCIWKLYTCIWPCMYNMGPKAISNYILDMVYSLYIHLAMPRGGGWGASGSDDGDDVIRLCL